ncbi:nucleoside triphosphate pyrophosphohydrolase [Parasphingopyxis algicola]|uniref:nucleoside triphosphate pyrophosphohydrolase n=1 Tax=Parasphingopyxis algicola TaxID=2026624 RepID=UPI0015A1BC34|nr:nucleoside triphosphate pyrophosphohydrolase [Parasphingopyxis algicola]QLC24170.1 nucleoside triphosphate pyrophosphohydrolase [Parasphingopyxis algicola]
MDVTCPSRPDDHLGDRISRLATIMERLRDPKTGCPWDVEQDFTSIAPYTIEEAYEVADAIERDDMAALKDELGDLQLQVVFHARMAEEAGHFALSDVLDGISDKMIRRHPHVFGPEADNGDAGPGWEAIKEAERAEKGGHSTLDGVATALPALLRAEKLQKRAARAGFDWPDATGPRAKIEEEISEVECAKNDTQRTEEIGDLLFAVVNWARHLKIDPEAALRAANAKFERRFRTMEERAGAGFSGLSLDEMERLWAAAKREEA